MATALYQVYQCEKCGNVVIVVQQGAGKLVCCGQPMTLLQEKTADQGKEKHVPIIEKTAEGVRVKVGSVAHPMEQAHYIGWIEVIDQEHGFAERLQLRPGQQPVAEFAVPEKCRDHIVARAYCNLHGLWRSG